MRGAVIIILAVLFVGLYVVDYYEHDGQYSALIWKQANADVQNLQDQLRAWWRGR